MLAGSTNNILQIALAAFEAEDSLLSGVDLRSLGRGKTAFILASVKLFFNADANGQVTKDDVLLASDKSSPNDDSLAMLTDNVTIPAGSTPHLLVAVDL